MQRTLGLCVIICCLFGCSGRTVVPAEPKANLRHNNPNRGVIIRAETAALMHMINKEIKSGRYLVQLPPRSDEKTYERVLKELPFLPKAYTKGPKPTGQTLYRVARVEIDGEHTNVLIIRPQENGNPQAVTVYMRLDASEAGWYITRQRDWDIPVEKVLATYGIR